MGKADDEAIYFDSNKIDDEFCLAIGRVTISFANLELTLSLFCGAHIGSNTPIVNQIITSELSFKQLVNISVAVHREVESNEDKIEKFYEIAKKLFALEQRRNAIIHSNYGSQNKLVVRQKASAKGKKGFRIQYEDLTPEMIMAFNEEIETVSRQIGIIIFELSVSNKG
jgi:hypothetical protein